MRMALRTVVDQVRNDTSRADLRAHQHSPLTRSAAKWLPPKSTKETSMQRSRLRSLAILALCAAALAPVGTALAQGTWPARPVRIIVTFPPGGAPDTLARILAEKWSVLGQPVTVENKPGAGGNLGADMVAKAPGG